MLSSRSAIRSFQGVVFKESMGVGSTRKVLQLETKR
ncbi:hypothetical protein [Caudoviricetes sp.]|nr:hypothetical protein [Caudoviricetes sp.]